MIVEARLPESLMRSALRSPRNPWRMIIATRNRLSPAFLGIDDDTVWSIIQTHIPELISGEKSAEALLERITAEKLKQRLAKSRRRSRASALKASS